MNKKFVASGARTNKIRNSLVKVVVEEDLGKWMSPELGAVCRIDSSAVMPVVRFEIETVEPPPYVWRWRIAWDAKVSGLRETAKRGALLKTYATKGEFSSDRKHWDVDLGGVFGGRLRVEVTAGTMLFKRYIDVRGINPSANEIEAVVKSIPDVDGLTSLLKQESHGKHFIEADGEPIVAFDNGYGITQMTNPAPSYEQVWSWKENVRAGARLYQEKQKLAKAYLSQSGRSYSAEQLRLETWSRWNGGAYHIWSEQKKAWIRNDSILCDSETGNIGWDATLEGNKGKSETDLHARDKGSYANPKKDKKDDNQWKYTGICYADHVDSSAK